MVSKRLKPIISYINDWKRKREGGREGGREGQTDRQTSRGTDRETESMAVYLCMPATFKAPTGPSETDKSPNVNSFPKPVKASNFLVESRTH